MINYLTNRFFCDRIPNVDFGGVAHLGERSVRNAEVEGSIPFVSTTAARVISGGIFLICIKR